MGRGQETGRRRGRRGFRPDSSTGEKGARLLEDCATQPTPPNTSIHLSSFPQASEAFVTRVFRSGFNAQNAPKSFLTVINITTLPSVLFFWEGDRTKTWSEGVHSKMGHLGIYPSCLPVYSTCQEPISCFSSAQREVILPLRQRGGRRKGKALKRGPGE